MEWRNAPAIRTMVHIDQLTSWYTKQKVKITPGDAHVGGVVGKFAPACRPLARPEAHRPGHSPRRSSGRGAVREGFD